MCLFAHWDLRATNKVFMRRYGALNSGHNSSKQKMLSVLAFNTSSSRGGLRMREDTSIHINREQYRLRKHRFWHLQSLRPSKNIRKVQYAHRKSRCDVILPAGKGKRKGFGVMACEKYCRYTPYYAVFSSTSGASKWQETHHWYHHGLLETSGLESISLPRSS